MHRKCEWRLLFDEGRKEEVPLKEEEILAKRSVGLHVTCMSNVSFHEIPSADSRDKTKRNVDLSRKLPLLLTDFHQT
jgi:hypothetical protein